MRMRSSEVSDDVTSAAEVENGGEAHSPYFLTALENEYLGQAVDRIDSDFVERWRGLYPWDRADAGRAPASAATALSMRAYFKVLASRPPGNIHTRLAISIQDAVSVGEDVVTKVWHVRTEHKRGRRHLEFRTESRGTDDRLLFATTLRFIWGR